MIHIARYSDAEADADVVRLQRKIGGRQTLCRRSVPFDDAIGSVDELANVDCEMCLVVMSQRLTRALLIADDDMEEKSDG